MSAQSEWEDFLKRKDELTIYGLENGLIGLYSEELIEKLRYTYEGGVPASIILLSNRLSNGHCYDRALLMGKALLDTEDELNLIYADVDCLRLNPRFITDSYDYADHCFLERITKEGERFIYDTSTGLIYQKDLYWEMEHPKVRIINNKESIKEFIENDPDKDYNVEGYDDFVTVRLIIPLLEPTLGDCREVYSQDFYPMLQQEMEYFKNLGIEHDAIIPKEEMVKKYGKK